MINLIFDFDGTLFDSSEGIYDAYALACDLVNIPKLSSIQFVPHIGPPMESIIRQLYPAITSQRLDEFLHYFRYIYDYRFYLKSLPYEGIQELLHYLRKRNDIYTLSVVTMSNTPTNRLLVRHNLYSLLDQVLGIDYLEFLKIGDKFKSKIQSIDYLKLN